MHRNLSLFSLDVGSSGVMTVKGSDQPVQTAQLSVEEQGLGQLYRTLGCDEFFFV